MYSHHEWKLEPCAGSVKVWQDSIGVYNMLFEHPRLMARLFGIGVACCLLTVRREGKFLRLFATQLSYVQWLELWLKESLGCQIPISRFIGQCGNSPSSSSSAGSLPASVESSSAAPTFHSAEPSGSGSSSSIGAGTDLSDDLTFLTVDDGAGVRTLHITVFVGNKSGDGIVANSGLFLAPNPEHGCELTGYLDIVFSEHHAPPSLLQPIRRKMEVMIAARFGILGVCLIEPVPHVIPDAGAREPGPRGRGGGASRSAVRGPPGMQHIGIVQDHMYANFGCKESALGSVLVNHEALDVATIDLSEKEGNAKQRSWEGGITVGSTSIAKGDVKHARASSSSKEVATLARSNGIIGTHFQIWDACRTSATAQLLSYKALHMPPIERVTKVEDAGLDTIPRDFVTSDFAMPMKLKCKGEFLLLGSGLKKHTFEMGRNLGEFQMAVDEGPRKKLLHRFHRSPVTLLQAKQKMETEFIVNHDFDLTMYRDAHLYWLLMGAATERTPAPDVLDAVQGNN